MSAGRQAGRGKKVVADSSKIDPKNFFIRLKKGELPAAAIAGAFFSFSDAARGANEGRKPQRAPSNSGAGAKERGADNPGFNYEQLGDLKTGFQRSISDIAVGPEDSIFALGDGEIRVFSSAGKEIRRWKAPENAACIAVGVNGRICIGTTDRVYILTADGRVEKSFGAGEPGRAAIITAIKWTHRDILVADAAERCIVRFDINGKRLGEIGKDEKMRGFILPNKSLDVDVNPAGLVVATDSGRHRISSWTIEGAPVRYFGKFGMLKAEDFVGCCNPVNVALGPDGKVVTAEKMVTRVKVYDSEGNLQAQIGPGPFDPKCTHLYLTVDSRGRIYVADPVRLAVKIFSVSKKARENV